MPLEDATVDKALTINTIYFWEDLASGFEEIARVLKPEGIFTSTHYTNRALESYSHTQFGYRMRTEQEVVSAAEIAGFTVRIKSIMDGRAYCVVGRRQA